MVEIQASTVPNQVTRKRKRKHPGDAVDDPTPAPDDVLIPRTSTETHEDAVDDEPAPSPEGVLIPRAATKTPEETVQTTTIATKTQGGGKKPRRTPRAKDGQRPGILRGDSSTTGECNLPWPDHFEQLAQTFRALNLVYTFFCTRKYLATTFDNLKTTVESHTKRELKVDDVAQIKALIPQSVDFLYVDEAMLQINMMGLEENVKGGITREFVVPETMLNEGVERKEVLLFELIDGDLKRQIQHQKRGDPTKPTQKLRNGKLKMPVFSQKQMMNLIDKRNAKFTSAINTFLNQCAEDKIDPVLKMHDEYQAFIPTPSETRESTPAREKRARAAQLPESIPKERKSISEIIADIKTLEWYSDQIVPDGHRVFDPQHPIHGDLNFQLSQTLVNALYNTKG